MSSLDCHLFSVYRKHDYLVLCLRVSFGNMLSFPIIFVYLSYLHKNFEDHFLLVLILSNIRVLHCFSQVSISGLILISNSRAKLTMALSSPQTSIQTLLLLLPRSMEWFILVLLLYILCLLFSFCCLILKSMQSLLKWYLTRFSSFGLKKQ